MRLLLWIRARFGRPAEAHVEVQFSRQREYHDQVVDQAKGALKSMGTSAAVRELRRLDRLAGGSHR